MGLELIEFSSCSQEFAVSVGVCTAVFRQLVTENRIQNVHNVHENLLFSTFENKNKDTPCDARLVRRIYFLVYMKIFTTYTTACTGRTAVHE